MKTIILLILLVVLQISNGFTQIIFSSDFETWNGNMPSQWGGSLTTLTTNDIVPYTTSPYAGNNSCQLKNSTNTWKTLSSQTISLPAKSSYLITLWVKGKGDVSISISDNNYGSSYSLLESNNWKVMSFSFSTFNTLNTEILINIKNSDPLFNDIQIDNCELKQIPSYLDINNLAANVFPNGDLFRSNSQQSGFEAPINSGKHPIYISKLWIAGFDASSSQLTIASLYNQNSYEYNFAYGPISNNYEDNVYKERYNRVWKINASTINNHIANYQNANYTVPSEISEWPGNGNVSNGEAQFLAPFNDVNGNSIYDPINGDYPAICGDQAIYFIFNDQRDEINISNKMGIEVHGMLYAFNVANSIAINNTIFLHYQIFNRSSENYNQVLLGNFTDYDLGDYWDDFIGSDSLTNMIYVYNGDSLDGDGNGFTYGSQIPAQGLVLLDSTINAMMYFHNSQEANYGNPSNTSECYNYLSGNWRDGTPLTYGGTGYGGTIPTQFPYSGSPETNTGWSAVSENAVPNDLRCVLSAGPYSLNQNDYITLDLAFPFAPNSSTNQLNAVSILKANATEVVNFYNSQNFTCNSLFQGINEEQSIKPNFQVYPNPNNGEFTLTISNSKEKYHVDFYSVLGNCIHSQNLQNGNNTISIDSNIGIAIYVVRDKNNSIVYKGKMVIE